MKIPTEAYPLTWPVGWPRHKGQRERAAFSRKVSTPGSGWRRTESLTVSMALSRLHGEASAFTRTGHNYRINPDKMIVSSNVPVRRDGLPISGRSDPVDPGVAVYFHFDGKPMVLACDKWDRVADNIAAVAAHLGAMRGMERWGVGKLAQVFAGYTALPAPGQSQVETWYVSLGLAHDCTFEQAREAYRELAKKMHPDNGGSHEVMTRLNAYWDQARQHFQR